MKTFKQYLKESGFREGADAIIFKGKQIDTDTIEYDMQDFSDMIAPIEYAKYTDGTEVDDEDLQDLDELPAMQDWISQDHMDKQADQADMYRDAQAHGDFESTNEEVEVSDDMREKISAWVDKYEKYIGGNGDTLPEGYMQWALNSGITTDFIEQNEADAMRKKYGEEEFENDPMRMDIYNDMPITKACMEELEKITGDDDIDTNARMVDTVMNGDGNESTNEDNMERGMGALDKFRELHRKSIGSNDDEVVLKELIEVINDDALFADEFPALKAFTNPSEFDDSEIVTAQNVPGDSADEKIMSLIKAIGDDSWVDDFAQQLMKDFNMGENVELDRIKELAGASIDETYDDDDAFYEAYGEMWFNEDDIIDEAEYQGRKVKLGKPMQGDVKKFKVYVKDPKTGNVKKVNFGHGGSSVKGKAMSIKKNNPKRRKSFRARHNCDNPGPRTKARYWSCRKW